MKRLRIDLYCGYAEDKSFTDHTKFRQFETEEPEELIERVVATLFENIEQLTYENEGDDE